MRQAFELTPVCHGCGEPLWFRSPEDPENTCFRCQADGGETPRYLEQAYEERTGFESRHR